MKFEGTNTYVATDDLRIAVNAAVTLRRPLLIKGEPGTGKTILAAEVAGGHLRALALVSPPVSSADLRVNWGCPALVLGGDQDPIAPADRLRVVAGGAGVELNVVSGADHSWSGFEDELGEALGEFFARHFQ